MYMGRYRGRGSCARCAGRKERALTKKKRSYTRPLFRAKREPEIVEPEELASGEAAAVGDTVVRRPATFGRRRMRGRVVYVHPAGRFHVVEFDLPRGGTLRECFAGGGK